MIHRITQVNIGPEKDRVTVFWEDRSGIQGTTEGSAKNEHIKELISRFHREQALEQHRL